MGKNVIWYNHTGRPNYISSIIKYLNHNPEEGNCIVEVKSKQGLKENIENLLKYSNYSKRSSKLEYILENAKENYNVYQKIKEVIL